MKSRDFAYWLQGLFELGNPKALDERQTDLVKRHLALVFKHDIDPSAGDADHRAALNEIHNPEPAAPAAPAPGNMEEAVKTALEKLPKERPPVHDPSSPVVYRC